MIAAWLLNLGGMALGMLIAPRRTWRAWLRGRQSQSLYGRDLDGALLARRLGELRRELGLDKRRRDLAPARASDRLLFLLFWQIGAWGSLATLPFAVLSALAAATVGLARRAATRSA
jgi:hypothetical protein